MAFAYSFRLDPLDCCCAIRAVIGLDGVKVGIGWMRGEATWGVRERDDVLLQLRAQFWNGKDPIQCKINDWIPKQRG
jgi:hypothetical protein